MTMSAFANTSGGRIIIGVNDNAEIIGFEDAKIQDRLTNIVQDHCDPPPAFGITTRTVRGKPLVVITVRNGNDKPYNVKRKGIYVRAGATKRRATRYELDLMYTAKVKNNSWSEA
jgi:ATP-dependent DNA helicase RecG